MNSQADLNGFDRVVHFVRTADWESFPPEVRTKAKVCLLDALCAIATGSLAPISRITAAYARKLWPGGGEATIFMDGARSSAVGAAFANASAGNALDIDDGCRHVKGHPGAQLIPVALAVAEQCGRSGEETLTALVAGYETAIRIGHVWHNTREVYQACGSWGSVANAAVAARLMGLDEDGIRNAMGIAEYHAPNLPMMQDIDHPAMAKHGIGWGAVTGVMAAGMAAEGYTGIPSLLGDPAHADWVGTIGREFPMVAGVTFKHYASCLWGHPALMAARDLVKRHGIEIAEIAKIRIRGFHEMVRLGIRLPTTEEEAQFSVGWPLAALLLEGDVGPDQMLAHRYGDPAMRDLLTKMELVEDPEVEAVKEIGRWPCIVEITRIDGTTLSSGLIILESGRIGDDLGLYADLWRYEDIQEKFARFCRKLYSSARIGDIIREVDELDRAADIHRLVSLCKPDPD
ncbi:MAG TPA: MmgE/PrpD family protein [Desulfosarcina sp.]|nr:MmgE/PrpD family protein [Desulfosarcina sp.]